MTMTKKGKEMLEKLTSEMTLTEPLAIPPVILIGVNHRHCERMKADFKHEYPLLVPTTFVMISMAAAKGDIGKRLTGLSQGWVLCEVGWGELLKHPDLPGLLRRHSYFDVGWISDRERRDVYAHQLFHRDLIDGRPASYGRIASVGTFFTNIVWYMMLMAPSDLSPERMRWLMWAKDILLSGWVSSRNLVISVGWVLNMANDPEAPLSAVPVAAVPSTPEVPWVDTEIGRLPITDPALYPPESSIAQKMNEIDDIIKIYSDDGVFTPERHEVRIKRLKQLVAMATFGEELRDSLDHIKELEAQLEEQKFAPMYRAEDFIDIRRPDAITAKFPWLPHEPARSIARRTSSSVTVSEGTEEAHTHARMDLGDVKMTFGGKELPVKAVSVTFDAPFEFTADHVAEDEEIGMTAKTIIYSEIDRRDFRMFRMTSAFGEEPF